MLLILDEAQTGIGRTGTDVRLRARRRDAGHSDAVEDARRRPAARRRGHHRRASRSRRTRAAILFYTTHVSDPLPAAVGLKVIEIIERDRLVDRAKVAGARLEAGLRTLQQRYDCIGDVRGRGLLLGMEIVVDRQSKEPAPELGAAHHQPLPRPRAEHEHRATARHGRRVPHRPAAHGQRFRNRPRARAAGKGGRDVALVCRSRRVPERVEAGLEHRNDRRRREHIDLRWRADAGALARSPTASSAAGGFRARQTPRHRARSWRRRASSSSARRCRRLALPSSRSACRTLSMAGALARLRFAGEQRGEAFRVPAPAFETGPVAGGERRHLVEEEQFGVAVAPDVALAVFEIEPAANPLPRGPAARAERLALVMQPPAAIAHQRAARGRGEQFAEGIDAVLQRHGRGSKRGGRDTYNPATIFVPGRPGYPDEWCNNADHRRPRLDRNQNKPPVDKPRANLKKTPANKAGVCSIE